LTVAVSSIRPIKRHIEFSPPPPLLTDKIKKRWHIDGFVYSVVGEKYAF